MRLKSPSKKPLNWPGGRDAQLLGGLEPVRGAAEPGGCPAAPGAGEPRLPAAPAAGAGGTGAAQYAATHGAAADAQHAGACRARAAAGGGERPGEDRRGGVTDPAQAHRFATSLGA